MPRKPKPKRTRTVTITAQQRMVAKLMLEGDEKQKKYSMKDAMLLAGYAESVARRGNAAIGKAIRLAMLEFQGEHLQQMGQELRANPELAHDTVVGWLYQSMLDRNTKGVGAAKLLGLHRAIDMFVKDGNQQNVLVIQAPTEFSGLTNGNVSKDEDIPKALPPANADLPEYE
jgi:hypothetical protein